MTSTLRCSPVDILVDPISFFRTNTLSSRPGILLPASIVAGACILSLFTLYEIEHQTIALITSSIGSATSIPDTERVRIIHDVRSGAVLGSVAALFGSLSLFVYWLLATAILANFAVIAGSNYKYSEMFNLAGTAFVVYYAIYPVCITLLHLYPLTLSQDPLTVSRTSNELYLALAELSKSLSVVPPLATVRHLNGVALIWLHFLLCIAYRELYRVSWRQAALASILTAIILNFTTVLYGIRF
jgi:hypothetical protein